MKSAVGPDGWTSHCCRDSFSILYVLHVSGPAFPCIPTDVKASGAKKNSMLPCPPLTKERVLTTLFSKNRDGRAEFFVARQLINPFHADHFGNLGIGVDIGQAVFTPGERIKELFMIESFCKFQVFFVRR